EGLSVPVYWTLEKSPQDPCRSKGPRRVRTIRLIDPVGHTAAPLPKDYFPDVAMVGRFCVITSGIYGRFHVMNRVLDWSLCVPPPDSHLCRGPAGSSSGCVASGKTFAIVVSSQKGSHPCRT
ncbi:hypothetical protein BaRGS_00005164, partial [Batillaria attramentaria]